MLFFCCMTCIISCSSPEYNIDSVEPVKIVKAISDSIHLSSQVSNLSYVNGRYYLSDFYRGIISFDKSFSDYAAHNVNKPDELERQCCMFALNANGDICSYNPQNHNFVFERNGTEYGRIDAQNNEITLSSRFLFVADTIICPIIKNKMTAAVFTPEKFLFTCFPTAPDFDDVRMPFHSERILVRNSNYYFSIGKGLPIIQMFSSRFQQIYSYNLGNIKEVVQVVKQEASNKPNSYFVVIKDACVDDNTLFLLMATKDGGKYKCNHVLKFIIQEQMLEFEGMYELKSKIYSSICVNNNRQIVALTSKKTCIEIYEF